MEDQDPLDPDASNVQWHGCGAVFHSWDNHARFYLTIIDTATPYSYTKSAQNLFSGMFNGLSGSAVPPPQYAARLLEMIEEKITARDE